MTDRIHFALHNLIAHPICGLLWLVGLTAAGNWLHDRSAPQSMKETGQ